MTFILATGNQHKVGEFRAILEGAKFRGVSGVKNADRADAVDSERHEVYAYSEFIEPFEVVENGKSFGENATIKLLAIYEALGEAYRAALGLDTYKSASHNAQSPKKQNIADIAMPVVLLAEDSGICVPALGGEPGIYSARYAKHKGFVAHSGTHNSDDIQNLACLIEQIKAYKASSIAAQGAAQAGQIATQTGELRAYFIAYIAAVCSYDFAPLAQGRSESNIMGFEGRLDGFVIEEARGAHGFGYDPIFIPQIDLPQIDTDEETSSKLLHSPNTQTLAELSPSAKNTLSHRYRAVLKCLIALENLPLNPTK